MKIEKRLKAIMLETLIAMEETGHRIAEVNRRLQEDDLKSKDVKMLAGAIQSLEAAKARQNKTLEDLGKRLASIKKAKEKK